MSPLSLKDVLKRSGSHRLAAIIGSERLESIHEILGTSLTESRMVDILYRRYGTQILSSPAIRSLVLFRLPDPQGGYVLDGKSDPDRTLTPKERDRLKRLRWGRTLASSSRLIEVLGLSEDYLPEKVDLPPAEALIEPAFTLFPISGA